jgi:uncharacterized membrane protein HdeD (DUF308 family)
MSTETDFGHARSDVLSADLRAFLAQYWWAVALRGVAAVLFGLLALFVPGATIISLLLIFAAYMLVDGVFAIIGAVMSARRGERWALLLLEGLADIATGIIVLLWPTISLLAFMLLIAAWAIVSGGLMVGAAYALNMRRGRGWLVFSGVVSIVFGLLVAIAPHAGAIVLTWWIAVYALVFGIILLIFAMKLRAAARS